MAAYNTSPSHQYGTAVSKSPSQGLGIQYNYINTSPHRPLRSSKLSLPPVTNPLPPNPALDRPKQQPARKPSNSMASGRQHFTSFSAIPPPPDEEPEDLVSEAQTSSPRPLPTAPAAVTVTAPTPRIDFTRSPSSQSKSGSITSTSSRSSTSKGPRRMRSVELLKRMAKSDTPAGAPYVSLSGEEGDDIRMMAEDAIPESPELKIPPVEPRHDVETYQDVFVANPTVSPESQSVRRPLPRPRRPSESFVGHDRIASNGSVSSVAPLLNTQQPGSPDRDSSSDEHIFYRGSDVPTHSDMPDRSMSRLSDPEDDGRPRHPRHPQAMLMSRSLSQPADLSTVSERESESLTPSNEGQQSRRTSSRISNGMHSQNAALFSAENGGMMLAFSPSGDGTWREGEQIVGPHGGLIPTPQMPHQMQNVDNGADSDLMSRAWSESSMSHGHFGSVQQAPPVISDSSILHHRRSHSEGSTYLARQGTLFYPSGSTQRASEELGVMLGNRSRRLSQNKLLPPPPQEQWEHPVTVPEKVRLEASKKRKARVEVDVVLERDCIVEGGDVRGRMEVRVTGGKRSEGLRVGGGKVRIIGFEGESKLVPSSYGKLTWQRSALRLDTSSTTTPICFPYSMILLSRDEDRLCLLLGPMTKGTTLRLRAHTPFPSASPCHSTAARRALTPPPTARVLVYATLSWCLSRSMSRPTVNALSRTSTAPSWSCPT